MINNEISKSILTVGVYYKNNAPGGMASVAASYDKCFTKFNYISSWRGGNKFVKYYYLFRAIIGFHFQMLFNKQIKIVHIHTAAHNSFYRKRLFILWAKRYNKRVILHVHASQFKDFYAESDKKELIVTTLQVCDKIIVLSKSWKTYFTNIGIDNGRLCILNNIVHQPLVDIAKEEGKFPIKFLFLGELGDRKGIFDLLGVIAANKTELKDKIKLCIGGNGEVGRLKSYIIEHDLGDMVTFLGWVSKDKKQHALLSTDVFILPSYNEGLPIAILEAMSYGKAIISTDVGGIAEVVKNAYNGCLINPGDKKAIKNSLQLFVNKPSLIEVFGKNGLTIVKDYYAENVMQVLNGLYKKILV